MKRLNRSFWMVGKTLQYTRRATIIIRGVNGGQLMFKDGFRHKLANLPSREEITKVAGMERCVEGYKVARQLYRFKRMFSTVSFYSRNNPVDSDFRKLTATYNTGHFSVHQMNTECALLYDRLVTLRNKHKLNMGTVHTRYQGFEALCNSTNETVGRPAIMLKDIYYAQFSKHGVWWNLCAFIVEGQIVRFYIRVNFTIYNFDLSDVKQGVRLFYRISRGEVSPLIFRALKGLLPFKLAAQGIGNLGLFGPGHCSCGDAHNLAPELDLTGVNVSKDYSERRCIFGEELEKVRSKIVNDAWAVVNAP